MMTDFDIVMWTGHPIHTPQSLRAISVHLHKVFQPRTWLERLVLDDTIKSLGRMISSDPPLTNDALYLISTILEATPETGYSQIVQAYKLCEFIRKPPWGTTADGQVVFDSKEIKL